MGAIHQLLAARGAAGGSNPTAAAIRAKLVPGSGAWWEMSEASGTRSDSVGSNHAVAAGTGAGTANGVRGASDPAANFTGGGWLHVADNAAISVPAGGGDHCLFGWYYSPANATGMMAAKWDASSSVAIEYAAQMSGGNILGLNGSAGSGYISASQAAPAAGAWHFMVVWRDAADGLVRMQADNGAINVSASVSSPADTLHSLGFATAGGSVGTSLFTGRLQRWGYIKGAILTPTERAYLYNGGSGVTWAELQAA